jgi:hypothetical protein
VTVVWPKRLPIATGKSPGKFNRRPDFIKQAITVHPVMDGFAVADQWRTPERPVIVPAHRVVAESLVISRDCRNMKFRQRKGFRFLLHKVNGEDLERVEVELLHRPARDFCPPRWIQGIVALKLDVDIVLQHGPRELFAIEVIDAIVPLLVIPILQSKRVGEVDDVGSDATDLVNRRQRYTPWLWRCATSEVAN